MTKIPQLHPGDTIALLALSKPIFSSERSPSIQSNIEAVFNLIGLNIKIYPSCFEQKYLGIPSIHSRIHDFHSAIKDDSIKAIMSVKGGRNSNQLLHHINFKLLKKHPKAIIGYSDITTILNAIYAKTKVSTFHGPLVYSFMGDEISNFTVQELSKALFSTIEYDIQCPDAEIIQDGKATGTLIGGNHTSFSYLQGTKFMPKLKDKIILLEDTHDVAINAWDRALNSLSLQKDAHKIKGFLIGKNDPKYGVHQENLTQLFKKIKTFNNIPIMSNINFGHNKDVSTFIIGAKCTINTDEPSIKIFK